MHMGRFEKLAGSLSVRSILHYGIFYLTGLENDSDYTRNSSLSWDVDATGVLSNVLINVAAIMLITGLSTVLGKMVRCDDL